MAYSIQPAIKKGLDDKDCKRLLKLAFFIVAIFRQSPKWTCVLEIYSEKNNQNVVQLVQSYPTRWNSSLVKLDHLITLRRTIVKVLSEREIFNTKTAKNLEMLESDWEK